MTLREGIHHECLKEGCKLTDVDSPDRIDIILSFYPSFFAGKKKCDVELFLYDVHSKRRPIITASRVTDIVPFIDIRRRSITCTEKIESTCLNSDCRTKCRFLLTLKLAY